LLHALRQPIIDQAAADQLPAIYQWGESARAGGLMSYGPFRNDVYQAISRRWLIDDQLEPGRLLDA
jgi:hypothetical protein